MIDWKELEGFEPAITEDTMSFQPIRGAYVCKVVGFTRQVGSKDGNEYDFHSLNAQVVETVEGDKGDNRYMSKAYNTANLTEFTTPEDEKKRLLTDLCTAGLAYDLSSDEAFTNSLTATKDKLINVRAFPTKSGKQAVKIVKEFKLRKKKAEAGPTPF